MEVLQLESGVLEFAAGVAFIGIVVALPEFHDGEHDDEEGNGGHEEAEHDVADCFDAGLSGRETP